MHETTLMKIALCCTVLGLPALYVLSDTLDLSGRLLDRISGTNREAAASTTLTGTVVAIDEAEQTMITLQQLTTVIVPDSIHIPLNSTIRVKGRLANDTMIADEVRVE